MERYITENFIGSTFPTPKGGVLTIVGISGRKIDSHKVYRISCSICSKDKELFPDLFESLKSSLDNDHIPCGCSLSPRWSRRQYLIKIARECDKRETVDFNGFASAWDNGKTKIHLKCKSDGHEWSYSDINNFLGGKVCSECQRTDSNKPDQEMIYSFMASGKFLDGTTFTRNTKIRSSRGKLCYWDVRCPRCSEDEYVENGLCNGVFTCFSGDLGKGVISYRCSKSYRWNSGQREYQINEIGKKEGILFKGWVSEKGYTKVSSLFKWECKNKHPCTSSVSSFINKGRRCKTCAASGFNPGNSAYLYIVRWRRNNIPYYSTIKTGITNREVLVRVGEQKLASNNMDYEMLHTFHFDKGQDALDIENKIKAALQCKSCPKELLPDGWTETVEDTPDNLQLILDIINNH